MAYDLNQVEQIFNKLSVLVKGELDEQHQAGRIKGTEYADVFNKLMSQAMGLAFETPIKAYQEAEQAERVRLVSAQADDQEYVTEYIRPIELTKLQCDVELCNAQVKLVQAQTADQEFITLHIII